MELHTIGIDLGKTIFHLVGLNPRGEVIVRKKFSRAQLLRFTANRHVHLIGMEACGAPISVNAVYRSDLMSGSPTRRPSGLLPYRLSLLDPLRLATYAVMADGRANSLPFPLSIVAASSRSNAALSPR
jgi:hypothetical protein